MMEPDPYTLLGMFCIGSFIASIAVLGLDDSIKAKKYFRHTTLIIGSTLGGSIPTTVLDDLDKPGGLVGYGMGLICAYSWYWLRLSKRWLKEDGIISKFYGCAYFFAIVAVTILAAYIVLEPMYRLLTAD